MAHKSVLLNALVLFALVLSLVPAPALAGPAPAPALQAELTVATDAVVLVNSASGDYADFQHFIQPYLDHFGVPYTVLDIATQPIGGNIGDYALISWNVVFMDTYRLPRDTRERRIALERVPAHPLRVGAAEVPAQPIRLERNVWIGFDACVLPGVTIGEGSIVGAKSVVTQSVPPFTVVAGNPARVIRRLDASKRSDHPVSTL